MVVVAATSAMLLILAAARGQAQTLTVLHNFDLGTDGGAPFAGVTLDQQGRIYGTTTDGGTRHGVVYRLTHSDGGWTLTTLHIFQGQPDGDDPTSRVLFGPDGALYGTTNGGGAFNAGTVFSLRPPASACRNVLCPWSETLLYSFTGGADGGNPFLGDLAFDQAGNIYGTASAGGANNAGVVFELTRSGSSWTETVLYSFTGGEDGSSPYAGVTFDAGGNVYGTTANNSVVYELSASQSGWTETTLHNLNNDDGCGFGGVTIDAHGNLFGLTGGPCGAGIAYELSPSNGSWVFSRLAVLPSGYEGPWDTPTLDAQRNLYGTLCCAGGSGEVFEMTPTGIGWNFLPLHIFDGSDGDGPSSGVTFDSSGNMYGTTQQGGSGGWGTVWELTP